jgi:hypothetical protein
MKQAGMISTSKLSLFVASVILGASALMYAQEQREDSKPNETSRPAATKDEKTHPTQNDKRGDTATPQDSRDQGARAPEQNEDRAVRGEDRSSNQQDNNSRMEQRTDRNTQSNRETNHETSNRDSRSERGTAGNDHRGGGRIPEEQFQSHFGRQHTFVVSHPTVVGGQSQFQYGGYTFNVIGEWPADWSYSDEYYVDSINDDYVLFDLAHPGISVAIVVVM